MVFLLDESNIHSQDGMSSVVLVHVADLEQLLALDAHVEAVERRLSIRPFHWWKSNWRVRHDFIRGLLEFDFRVRVGLFNNPVDIEAALEHALPYLLTETEVRRLIIDGSKPKEYASRLKKVLRDKGVTVKKLKLESDQARPALRVADALAGLMRHHAEDPKGKAAELRLAVSSRIDVTLVP
ncbi:hypothetical protein [Streptomyces sp. NPDC002078]